MDVTKEGEPDIVLCEDGNFQHKRHTTASVPIPGYEAPVPELFVPPKAVQEMAEEVTRLSLNGHSHSEADRELEAEVVSYIKIPNNTHGSGSFFYLLVSIPVLNLTLQLMILAVKRILEAWNKQAYLFWDVGMTMPSGSLILYRAVKSKIFTTPLPLSKTLFPCAQRYCALNNSFLLLLTQIILCSHNDEMDFLCVVTAESYKQSRISL